MSKTTLVLGASENPDRYSYLAIQKLISHGHSVKAIGRRAGEVNGVKFSIEKLPFKNIDTVTLYLGKQNQQEYYEYIIGLKPNRVIFNPGTENPEFEELLNESNIEFEKACTLVLLSTNQF